MISRKKVIIQKLLFCMLPQFVLLEHISTKVIPNNSNCLISNRECLDNNYKYCSATKGFLVGIVFDVHSATWHCQGNSRLGLLKRLGKLSSESIKGKRKRPLFLAIFLRDTMILIFKKPNCFIPKLPSSFICGERKR